MHVIAFLPRTGEASCVPTPCELELCTIWEDGLLHTSANVSIVCWDRHHQCALSVALSCSCSKASQPCIPVRNRSQPSPWPLWKCLVPDASPPPSTDGPPILWRAKGGPSS